MGTRRLVLLLTIMCVLATSLDVKAEALRCLAFNMWHCGRHVDNGLEKAADIAKKLQANIISYSEVKDKGWDEKMLKIYKAKGMNYYASKVPGTDVCLLSKFPVKSAKRVFGAPNSGTKYELDVNGKKVIVIAIHLDYKGYASNLPRGYNTGSKSYPEWKMIDDGSGNPKIISDPKEILRNNAESKKEKQIIDAIASVKGEGAPVIILGDFNEPSFLDWTEKTKDMFAHHGAIVEWPTSKLLYKAGFKDAYRTKYPNEREYPGITWPSEFEKKRKTTWAPKSDDRDRVDYIYYRGDNLKLNSAGIVGPKASYKLGKRTLENTEKDNFILTDMPWPTDHKAVFAELILK